MIKKTKISSLLEKCYDYNTYKSKTTT